ncbi:MAG: hypothetical protein J6K84_01510 [Oscillospiraceae bacterium]|nr:hypothetical protein [Oscillospiraceae bacterium]
MKKTALILIFALMLTLCACGKNPAPIAVTATDTIVAIAVPQGESGSLLSYMEKLQKEGQLSFTMSGTLLTEMNGTKNTADFSSCWMLYTDDGEFSDASYGTATFEGKTYASALLGAEALQLKEGCTYLWVYQSFNS